VFDERELALAIQCLRRRLQTAEDAGASRALIRALEETLTEFEAGRMPHRYGAGRPINCETGPTPVKFLKPGLSC
jgi:hypothetical protein